MCQDLQEQLDVAQATLDQKEHDMLLVSQGRTLLGVSFLILPTPAALWQKPLKLACLLHSWTAPLQGQATSPATDSCSLLVLCDIQCRSSPLACLSFWQLLLLHS